MLTAVFYAFSKRENSTLIPSSSVPSYSMQIDINDPNTSVLNPQLRVRMPSSGTSLLSYNYVYIQDLLRYYYIDDWTYNADGTWTASCSVDVLASWKTYIMTSGGYVGRSEAFFDGGIQDISYPAKNEPVTIRNNVSTGFSPVAAWGTIVVGIVTSQPSVSSGIMGGTRYYALNSADFLSFVQHLLGFWTDNTQSSLSTVQWALQEATQTQFQNDWFKSLYTPAEYVISCRYYPVKFNIPANATKTPLCLGGWTCGGNGGVLIGRMYEELPYDANGNYIWGEIDISNVADITVGTQHPYNNDDYPSYAPYASYELQTPWGSFELDANHMSIVLQRTTKKIYWKIMLNLVTGTGTLVVADTPNYNLVDNASMTTKYEFFRQEVNIAVDIPLMAQYQDEMKILTSGAKMLGSALKTFSSISSEDAEGAKKGLINTAFGIADTIESTKRYADGSKQYNGNNTPLITQMTVQQVRYPTVEKAPSLFGKPLKRYVSALNSYNGSAFSGFVQLDYSNFKAPCTEIERARVRNYLEGGVHIE